MKIKKIILLIAVVYVFIFGFFKALEIHANISPFHVNYIDKKLEQFYDKISNKTSDKQIGLLDNILKKIENKTQQIENSSKYESAKRQKYIQILDYLAENIDEKIEELEAIRYSVKPQSNIKIYTDSEPYEYFMGEKIKKVVLKVEENRVYMDGTITTSTPSLFKKIFSENPQIDTLVMQNVEGSLDDDANLELASWIEKKDLRFILEKQSHIASGGTDFFLAGANRIIYAGAKVGVHSWAESDDDGSNEVHATDFSKGHKKHQPYIDYFQAIGWNKKDAEDFYYFTIYAAGADDMHYMTDQELIDYKITTEGKIRK